MSTKKGKTTTSTEKEQTQREIWKDPVTGEDVDVTPIPLIKVKEEEEKKEAAPGASKVEGSMSQSKIDKPSESSRAAPPKDQSITESKSKPSKPTGPGGEKDTTSFNPSMTQTDDTSSSVGTTEEEDGDKDEKKYMDRYHKQIDLEETVDIHLTETETFVIFTRPALAVGAEQQSLFGDV